MLKILVIGVIVAALLLIGPWVFIWALNTLIAAAMVGAPAGAFIPTISFGFWTWLAAAVLGGFGIFTYARK